MKPVTAENSPVIMQLRVRMLPGNSVLFFWLTPMKPCVVVAEHLCDLYAGVIPVYEEVVEGLDPHLFGLFVLYVFQQICLKKPTMVSFMLMFLLML